MLNTFLQTKKHLYSLIPVLQKQKFPGELGLFRMLDLLKRLGNPQHQFPSVHITGTSGKGSTTYLISKIMQESGYKVGLTISPHLQTMRERMQINGKLINKPAFISLINQIKPRIRAMNSGRYGKPSYFEVLLATAFLHFSQQKVDLAVIEVGLGGRYDASNVLNPEVAVLTNIGLDHTRVLGKTKDLILQDKMQIIKTGCPAAVSAVNQKNLLKILKKHCRTQQVSLFVYNKDFQAKNKCSNEKYSKFDFIFNKKRINNIKLSLPGVYQIDNSCVAIASCLELARKTKFELSDKIIKKALSKTFFPGRMEIVSRKPLIILDGAHNEDKIRALVESIKEIYPKKKFIIVFGVKKDKDANKMLLLLKKFSCCFVFTEFGQATDMGFNLNFPVKKLFELAKKAVPKVEMVFEKSVNKALIRARKLAVKKRADILLTGSLYIVGEARQYFKLKPNCRAVFSSQ